MASEATQALWTVLGLLEWSADYFEGRGIDSPRLTAELLLGRVLGLERISLYTNYDRPLSTAELASFKELLRRRLAHEPVQYILGETSFMGLRFTVNPDVLVPRPETELLVERAVELEAGAPGSILRVLDIGTGSGCIAASVARFLPACRVDAIDVSDAALRTAAANARSLGVAERVRFLQHDFLAGSPPLGPYDLVLANPPYVSAGEFLLLEPEVRLFEPAIATTDNADGLTFYRAIASQWERLLAPGGVVMAEVAYDQARAVSALFEHAGGVDIAKLRDYAGIERIVRARRRREPIER